jgi:hypothetical protein
MVATDGEMLSVPQAAMSAGIPLDKLRRRARENRARLREVGVLVKIGPLDFVRAEKLAELAALVQPAKAGAGVAAGA